MKTVLINDTYVRISAIDSVTIHRKRDEHDLAYVSVYQQMVSQNVSFKTDKEAEDYIKKLVDLINEQE